MEFKTIKTIRNEQNITLAELGERTGYSASFLSQIERGVNRPSLEALRKIGEALGVNAAALLAKEALSVTPALPTLNGYKIIRNSEETIYNPWQENSTYYHTLFNLPVHTDNMIVSKIYIDTNASASGKMIAHNLCEINFILKGQAIIELEHESFILYEGDAIYLDAFTKHNFVNQTDEGLSMFTMQF